MASPSSHPEIEVMHDSLVRRARGTRLMFAVFVAAITILAPAVLIGLFFGSDKYALLGVPLGFLILSRAFRPFLVYVPPAQAFLSFDELTGKPVAYGPGTHVSFPWESRRVEGNHPLQSVTSSATERLSSLDDIVSVSWFIHWRIDLANIERYAGHFTDVVEVGARLSLFVRRWLAAEIAVQTSGTLHSSTRELSEKLASSLASPYILENSAQDSSNLTSAPGPGVSFQKYYGIRVESAGIESISFSGPVTMARSVPAQQEALEASIASQLGLSRDEVKQRLASNTIDAEQFRDAWNRALMLSGRDVSIAIVENRGSALMLFDGHAAGVLDAVRSKGGTA